MKRTQLFAIPIWQDHLSSTHHDELIQIAYATRDADPNGIKKSNRGGYHSAQFREIPLIQDEVINRAKEVVAQYNFAKAPHISSAWFNISNGPNTNSRHHHAKAFLSGVYHVKTTEHSGAIRFHRNPIDAYIVQSMSTATELNELNSPVAVVPAVAGQLLIFPSWAEHSVDANDDDEDRISIAFNIILK
tara:strand:- start:1939 stop:2505 length:567 start_codon:yes stop_codon:yes gene_type:complete